jgi:hypothetical protein
MLLGDQFDGMKVLIDIPDEITGKDFVMLGDNHCTMMATINMYRVGLVKTEAEVTLEQSGSLKENITWLKI